MPEPFDLDKFIQEHDIPECPEKYIIGGQRSSLALKLADALEMAAHWKQMYLEKVEEIKREKSTTSIKSSTDSIVKAKNPANEMDHASNSIDELKTQMQQLIDENRSLNEFKSDILTKRQQRRNTLLARLSCLPPTALHKMASHQPTGGIQLSKSDIEALKVAGEKAASGKFNDEQLSSHIEQFLQHRRATMAYKRQSLLAENMDVLNKMTAILDKIVSIEKEFSRIKKTLSESESKNEQLTEQVALAVAGQDDYELYLRQLQIAVKSVCKKAEQLQQLQQDYQAKKVKSDLFKQQVPRDVTALLEGLTVIRDDMERKLTQPISQQRFITPPVTPQPSEPTCTSEDPKSDSKPEPLRQNLLAEIRNGSGIASLKKVDATRRTSGSAPLMKSMHAVRDIQVTLKTAIERHRRNMLQAEEELDDWDDWA